MPFLLLLLLTLACLPDNWSPPPAWTGLPPDRALLAILTWSEVALLVAAAFFLSRRTVHVLIQHTPSTDAIQVRHSSWKFYHLIMIFLSYGLSLYVLGWGWTVQTFSESFGPLDGHGKPQMVPGAELLMLAPF